MILPLPEREKVESELRDEVLERGEQKTIAGYLQIKPSRVSRQLDPDNEDCPSPVFQFLQWLWAMDCGGKHRGDALIDFVVRERGKWLVNFADPHKDSGQLTTQIFEKATDFLKTETGDSDVDTQLNKLDDVRRAVETKADQLKLVKAENRAFI